MVIQFCFEMVYLRVELKFSNYERCFSYFNCCESSNLNVCLIIFNYARGMCFESSRVILGVQQWPGDELLIKLTMEFKYCVSGECAFVLRWVITIREIRNRGLYFRSGGDGRTYRPGGARFSNGWLAGADNPNRVSRLNKDPFVFGTSFDPPDVFAHPPRYARSLKRAGRYVPSTFYNCFLGRGLCTLPILPSPSPTDTAPPGVGP